MIFTVIKLIGRYNGGMFLNKNKMFAKKNVKNNTINMSEAGILHRVYNTNITKILDAARSINIQNRLRISFLILSLIPIMIVGMFSYKQSSDAIKSKISTYSVQVMNSISQNIYSEAQKYKALSDEFMLSKTVQDGLLNYNNTSYDQKRLISYNIRQVFQQKFSRLSNVSEMEIVTNDHGVVFDQGYVTISNKDIERLTSYINTKSGYSIWDHINIDGNNLVVLVRGINDAFSGTRIGSILIAIDESAFSNIYNNVNIGEGTDIFIMNGNGKVVSSRNDMIKIGSNVEPGLVKKIKETPNSDKVITQKITGKNYLVAFNYLSDYDWYMVCSIPYSYLNGESNNIKYNTTIICLVCFVFSIIFSFIISQTVSVPIKSLNKQMDEVVKGNLDVVVRDTNKDEIGSLSRNFNKMIKQVRALIEQVKEEQKLKHKFEIRMLQAQINPHFLFNTLNSLKWTAVMSQAESVSVGLGALSEILSNTILDTNEFISIRGELKNIDNYIIIQKLRYGSSFKVQYILDEELMDFKILKFILQPIVENSIIHGIDEEKEQSEITITLLRKSEDIQIIIKDNGRGFDKDVVKDSFEKNKRSSKKISGMGVSNVRDRIKLNFGNEYELRIKSEVGIGTEVYISLPIIYEEGADTNV